MMIKYKNLKEHIKYIAAAFKRRGEFYRKRGLELTPSTHTFLWSQRRYLVDICTRSVLVWTTGNHEESPLLKKWRATSVTNDAISRRALLVLCEYPSASLSRIATECEPVASRETVRRAMAISVDLGLIKKRGDEYEMTEQCADELFNRTILGIRHPDMVEFARFVLAINQAEALIQNPRYQRTDDHPLATPLTLAEEIAAGRYTGKDDE